MDYLVSEYIDVKKEYVGEIPVYIVRPKTDKKKLKTVLFYHGWGSDAKKQIFRANIFAIYGYQVILPEARDHGERGSLNYEDTNVLREKLCETIMHNIEEFPSIYKYVVEKLNADEENIILSGHSMGAITSAGLFTFKKSIKAGVLFNGICDWEWIVNKISNLGELSYEMMRINEFMLQMNPKEHSELIADRYLIMHNGENDDEISADAQEQFYHSIMDAYKDKSKIQFTKWEKTYHQLTTQMLEAAIVQLNEITEK